MKKITKSHNLKQYKPLGYLPKKYTGGFTDLDSNLLSSNMSFDDPPQINPKSTKKNFSDILSYTDDVANLASGISGVANLAGSGSSFLSSIGGWTGAVLNAGNLLNAGLNTDWKSADSVANTSEAVIETVLPFIPVVGQIASAINAVVGPVSEAIMEGNDTNVYNMGFGRAIDYVGSLSQGIGELSQGNWGQGLLDIALPVVGGVKEAIENQKQQDIINRYKNELTTNKAIYNYLNTNTGLTNRALGGSINAKKSNAAAIDKFAKEYTVSPNFNRMSTAMGDDPRMIRNRVSEIINFDPNRDIADIKDGGSFVYFNELSGRPNIVLSGTDRSLGTGEDVLAHEYGHLGFNSGNMQLPKAAIDGINSRNQVALEVNSVGKKQYVDNLSKKLGVSKKEAAGILDHDLDPRETRSDLFQLRYQLNKAGIYDSSKDGEFTKDHMDKLRKLNVPNRLRRMYKPEDVIWLMNNIASSESRTNSYAFGGPIDIFNDPSNMFGDPPTVNRAYVVPESNEARLARIRAEGEKWRQKRALVNAARTAEMVKKGKFADPWSSNVRTTSPIGTMPIRGCSPMSSSCARVAAGGGSDKYGTGGLSGPAIRKAFGGPIEYSTGGSHESNPYGGIPIDESGNPSSISGREAVATAEEGEVTFGEFVFSDRLSAKGRTRK